MLSATADQLILGQDAWEYFHRRIQRIQLTENGVGLCGEDDSLLSVVAYYEPREKIPTMHICKAFAELDMLVAAAVLVHEARHTEGFRHVNCSRGRLRGEKVACDMSYKLKGSYATEVEYKARLAQHEQVDPILRRSSRIAAVTDLFERFNDAPMGLREVALVQADDGSVLGYNGRSFERAGIGTPTQVMVDREGEPILFDSTNGSVKTYALGQVSDTDGWLAARFREIGKGRTDFKDALFSAGYNCLLFTSEMRCGPVQGPRLDAVVRLSRIRPVGFLYRSDSRLVKEGTPYLVADNGALYALPASHSELLKLKEVNLKARRTKKDLLKISPRSNYEKGEYLLTQDGQFMLYQESPDGSHTYEAIQLPDGLRLKSVVSPVIWSKDLRTL